jgi:transposase
VRGLPSLEALDGGAGPRIWLAVEATDMRCGFDRLAERVQTVIGQDPLSGHLFVFPSRCRSRLKILVWDRDGYVLWYKRLEEGVFKLPARRPGVPSVELRTSELAMLLDGIDLSKLKRTPRYQRQSKQTEESKTDLSA